MSVALAECEKRRESVRLTYPTTPQRVQVRGTYTTMGNLDFDVGFFPGFGLERLVFHG